MTLETRLAEIEERLAKATPGPWILDNSDPNEPLIIKTPEGLCLMQFSFSYPNCDLAAHAPTDLARLCQALRVAVNTIKLYSKYCDARPADACELFGCKQSRQALAEIERVMEGK